MAEKKTADWEDFSIQWNGKEHSINFGDYFPEKGRFYLSQYIGKINKYKNIKPDLPMATFSLYQPPASSSPGKRTLVNRLMRRFERKRTPAVATIGLTKRCQCRCRHCSASYHMNSAKRELSDKELISAIGETVSLGVTNIILVGGEPMLKKGIYRIIDSVDKDKSIVTMFTNGEFLTMENCLKLKESGLFGIFFSLDSSVPELHDNNRQRKGIFTKLEKGVGNALKAGFVVSLSSYLDNKNLSQGHLGKMMQLGEALGVHEVTFFDAIAVGRYKVNGATSALLPRDHEKILKLTKYFRTLKAYPAISPQSVLTSHVGSSFCYAANTQFYLSSVGEMTPCDFTPLSIGNYPESSIQDLWEQMIQSPFYKKRSKICRMQDKDFRAKTIDRIPATSQLPYPMQLLETKTGISTGGKTNEYRIMNNE